jgi:hypothetical protein
MDGILANLNYSNIGYFIGMIFLGAIAYADGVVLLAPTPSAMRTLLQNCDENTKSFNISFKGCKSNCMYISPPFLTFMDI